MNPFVMCLYSLTTTHLMTCHHRIIVGFILAGWGDGPGRGFHGNCIRQQLHFMRCNGKWVHLGPTAARQCSSCQRLGYGSHRHVPLLCSPRLTHAHPTHTHVAGCSLCVLLVTMVHPFDSLLHARSIQHGNHDGGLPSRATMTTNTFGS